MMSHLPHFFRAVLMGLVALGWSASGADPGRLLDDYAVQRWQMEEGLPEDSVRGLLFSSDGYLWCLTDKAVSRFDGLRFDTFEESRRESAGFGLMENRGGEIWAYGTMGAYRAAPRGGNWIGAASVLSAKSPIRRLLQGDGDALWAVGSNGVYRLEGRHSRFFSLPKRGGKPSPEVSAVEGGADGRLWLASGQDVLSFERGSFGCEAVPAGGILHSLSLGRDGVMWAATDTNLLCRTEGRWQTVPLPSHRNHPRWRITALYAFDSAELWVGTTSGLWCLRGGVWSALSPYDGFYPLEIRSIVRDTEGNIWAASSGGLLRLRRKVVQVYDSGLRLERHTFTAVLPDSGAGMWVGVAGGGLLEGAPGAFHFYQAAPVSRTAVISALLKTRDGALWIGTQGDYLWRCSQGKAECIVDSESGDNSAVNINALLEDRNGRVWVGTGSGLMTYEPRNRRLEPVAGVSPGGRVHTLMETREGDVWAGSQGDGIIRISSNGQVAVMGPKQRLSANAVMALCQDRDGMVWAGTTEGLSRWDGHRWTSLTEKQGLPEGTVVQILEEGPFLWVGSQNGISRLAKAELAAVTGGLAALLNPKPFGRNEGMREEQCSSGFGNLAAKDAEGRLWFSTLNGLVMIDPRRAGEKTAGKLRAYIEEVRLQDKVILSRQDGLGHAPVSFTCPAGTGRISIRYSAPFFSAPEQVQFKRMMEGYDVAWSAPTASRSAIYTRLPAGTYRFRVMAGVGGAWRESAQSVAIVVQPFLWQKWWFWVIVGGLGLALVGLWVRGFEKRRSRLRFLELERQGALERERSRIAHDLHDDLGAALTEIGLLSAVAQRSTVTPERARHYLSEVSDKVRRMVDTLDEIVWAINPRNDTVTSLGDYFCEYAQRILKLTVIRCRLDLSPDLPAHPLDPDRRHNLFLAFSEALNNVIRHSGATEVRIRIEGTPRRLVVSVEDNGRGLGTGVVSEGAEGLKSMRRRLERMGGMCEIEGRDGQGTTVRFKVPLD
jgi:ligand-binding sensor domain-containing protein/signal transduction histidine kinase